MSFFDDSLRNRIVETLGDRDFVLAYETSADFLFVCNQDPHRLNLTVYCLEDFNLDGVECIVVDSYDNIEIVDQNGIRCTSPRQTIIDLLRNDRNQTTTVECVAWWWHRHNYDFSTIDIPDDIREEYESYFEDAMDYYRH